MMKMERLTNSPKCLKNNKEIWTKDWKEKVNKGKTNNFNWHNKSKEILTALKEMTANHCAFCDVALSPIGDASEEIEHFKPKVKFPNLSYDWNNLYPICSSCNKTKSSRFDYKLLRPDELYFEFSKWFRIDMTNFEIKPQKLGNSIWEIERAEKTIEYYGLNKKAERRKFFYHNQKDENKDKNIQSFRFLFHKNL